MTAPASELPTRRSVGVTTGFAALTVLLALVAGALPAAAAPDPTPPPVGPADLVRDHAARFAVPATAAVVVTPEGATTTVLDGATSDGAPVTAGTRFRIASMSKAFTAVAVLQLAEEGRLRLDQPVAELLPGFAVAAARGRPITVRDLLAHTSGLAAADVDEFALPPPASSQAVVNRLRDVPQRREPGTAHEYLNTHYVVVARVVETLVGVPFDRYLRDAVLRPLGMTATIATDRCDARVPGLALGHAGALGVQVAVPEIPSFCAGDGGIVTTAADMTRWLRFQRGTGAPLLAEASLRASHAAPGTDGRYGLGWSVRTDDAGRPLVRHTGAIATFSSAVELSASGAGAVVLTDAVDPAGTVGTLAHRLVALAGGAPAGPPASDPWRPLHLSLVGLAVAAGALLGVAVIRAPRRAAALGGGRRPVSLPVLAVLAGIGLLPLIWAVYSGPSATGWTILVWMLPTAAVLALVLVVGATAALLARARARRRHAAETALPLSIG